MSQITSDEAVRALSLAAESAHIAAISELPEGAPASYVLLAMYETSDLGPGYAQVRLYPDDSQIPEDKRTRAMAYELVAHLDDLGVEDIRAVVDEALLEVRRRRADSNRRYAPQGHRRHRRGRRT